MEKASKGSDYCIKHWKGVCKNAKRKMSALSKDNDG